MWQYSYAAFFYIAVWLRNPFPMSSLLKRYSSEHSEHHIGFRKLFLAPTLHDSKAQAAAPTSKPSRALTPEKIPGSQT